MNNPLLGGLWRRDNTFPLSKVFIIISNIMSRASEVGSPTNHPGVRAAGSGILGPFTGGLDLRGSLQPAVLTKTPQDFNVPYEEHHLKSLVPVSAPSNNCLQKF